MRERAQISIRWLLRSLGLGMGPLRQLIIYIHIYFFFWTLNLLSRVNLLRLVVSAST